MDDLNAAVIRKPMPYIADPATWIMSAANKDDYAKRELVGHCAKCGSRIVPCETEETFFMDAGYGFNWIVSNQKSGLCKSCFEEMKATAKPSTYEPEHVRRVGKYRANNIDYEIIEADPDYAPLSETDRAWLSKAIKPVEEKHESRLVG